MNRFPDTFQTVIDRSLFGPSVLHDVNTLTTWLTNTGCVAQALSSLTHSFTVCQTIMSAMSQKLQSDLCVAAQRTSRNIAHFCRSWMFLRWIRTKNFRRSGKPRMMSRADHWTHMRSKMPVRRTKSICGTWRCTSTPLKRKHGLEQDANQLASSGSVPTSHTLPFASGVYGGAP